MLVERNRNDEGEALLKKLEIHDPLADAVSLQAEFLVAKPLEKRKALGQFFTGSVVSQYMASLIRKPESETVSILDAGAGTGILTAASALRCLEFGCKTVKAVLYELDEGIRPYLLRTMATIQDAFDEQGCVFSYEIRCEDFVLSRPDQNTELKKFDVAVINPPYFKYSVKYSPYAKAVGDLYRGDPNIYASFMAVVLACLKPSGQMISISPRSFTNGLYFKGFRAYLLAESSLDLIHIFKHRDKVFKSDVAAVLQENIICHFTRGREQSDVTIRASDCDASIESAIEQQYPPELIIDASNEQQIIRIPESAYEAGILKQAETLSTTFTEAGYFISTGRVVEHRTRNFITNRETEFEAIPLYRPHNITPPTATWTGEHKKDVNFMLLDEHEKHSMKNGTHVLLKRFTSKDEKRRLVAAVHLKDVHDCELIGFGNKTNYVGVTDGELSDVEAYGLAAIFNSSFMDKYFRCISGNTQVNATEVRVMRFPSRHQVIKIGEQVVELKTYETSAIDRIVNPILGIMDSI